MVWNESGKGKKTGKEGVGITEHQRENSCVIINENKEKNNNNNSKEEGKSCDRMFAETVIYD